MPNRAVYLQDSGAVPEARTTPGGGRDAQRAKFPRLTEAMLFRCVTQAIPANQESQQTTIEVLQFPSELLHGDITEPPRPPQKNRIGGGGGQCE